MADKSILIKYLKGIKDFESYIKKEKENMFENFKTYLGYIINLEEYNQLKKNINYEENCVKYKEYFTNPEDSNPIKLYTLEEIKFRDSYYLLNKIFNGNKFILINIELWKLLCKENKESISPIKFEINYMHIKFKLDAQKELIFWNDKNFIISSFYQSYNPDYSLYYSNYYDILNNIYNKISEYFDYEKEFKEKLKANNVKNFSYGYLIDFDWFSKWEKCSNYLYIKSNYLEKNKSQKEIMDLLIDLNQMKKINIESLGKPKIYNFKKNEEFYSFIKEKKLIMVNESFISSHFSTNEKTHYHLYNNKIEFNFDYSQEITINAKDNIITMKPENKEDFPNTLQIGKIFCFRKILKNLNRTDKSFPAILVKKEIINEYISKNSDKNLLNELKENILEKDYHNLQKKIKDIIHNLKTNNADSVKEIEKREKSTQEYNFVGNNYNLQPKIVTLKDKELICISDFEIIDEDIYN